VLRLPRREVSVLDVRSVLDRADIARVVAEGHPVAFYMGLFTILRIIGPPWRDRGESATFWTVKRGRPTWSKLPVFIRPARAVRLIDWPAVHPAFRRLHHRERFEALWAHGAPLHVVAPLRAPQRYLPDAIVTSPGDLADAATGVAALGDRRLDSPTASFFWMSDPAWQDLAVRLEVACPPRSWLVGSSFNDHGAPPPFTLEELVGACRLRPDLPFELIVSDPLLDACGGYSSHTLVRLPLADEPPALVLLRWGSVSPQWLAESTGLEVRVLDSVSHASRPAGVTDKQLQAAFMELHDRRTAHGQTRRR
jgi:hypothetical protein